MTTVTLFKLHSGFANISDDWSLDPTHADEYRGDYSAEYTLPEGYRVGRTICDEIAVYDDQNRYWDVTISRDGGPALVSSLGILPLKKTA